jgi:hypothetical protein
LFLPIVEASDTVGDEGGVISSLKNELYSIDGCGNGVDVLSNISSGTLGTLVLMLGNVGLVIEEDDSKDESKESFTTRFCRVGFNFNQNTATLCTVYSFN